MLLSQVGRDWYARHGAARDTRQAAVSQRHRCREAHCQAQQVQVRASSVGQCRAHRGVAAQTNRLRVFEAQTDARVAGVPFGQAQILRAVCTEMIARPFVKAWQSTVVSNFGHIFLFITGNLFSNKHTQASYQLKVVVFDTPHWSILCNASLVAGQNNKVCLYFSLRF